MLKPMTVVACFSVCLCGCNQSPTTTGVGEQVVVGAPDAIPTAFNADGLPTVTFSVPDMHCELMCAPKVKETLAEQPGVMDIQVDISTRTAVVAVKANVFDKDKTLEALESADFPSTVVEQATDETPEEAHS